MMHFDHLYNASAMIKTHVAFATAGVIIGALQLFGKKGGQRHKILGWSWAVSYTHLDVYKRQLLLYAPTFLALLPCAVFSQMNGFVKM